ncbi:CapA family protein [Nitrososphaera sp.]|uniref:CapA family protein n=1 Tax=Nitrososphaera sp. TaxID=1971748 RepID=UPI0031739465
MQIILTGDVMLGRMVNSVLDRDRHTYVWGDTIDIFREADLSLVNLECVISSKGSEWSKTFKVFHFRANPDAIRVLKTASIDYVSLANNHTLDYGNEALDEMLCLLKESGISYSGAGRNLKEAMAPSVLHLGNTRIGVTALTDNQPEWEATADSAGVNYIPLSLENGYADRLKECITSAREKSDIVIASSHVGPHFRESPSAEYVNFAHRAIDLGADVYWGHSNHMPQGIEIYKGRPILYDCGDFIDDYAVDRQHRNDLSFIFRLSAERGKIDSIELVPTMIHDFHASTAPSSEADLVMRRMAYRCGRLGTKCIIEKGRISIPVYRP